MVTIKSIQEAGNGLLAVLSDGRRIMCAPTTGGLWIPNQNNSAEPETFKWPFPRSQRNPPYEGHSGIDWAGATVGDTANVKAIGPGYVEQVFSFSGNVYPDFSEPQWRGNCIVVNHGTIGGREIWSLYAHLRDAPVFNVNDTITGGQVIGRVGNTGASAGAHLHFEVIYDGVRLSTGQGGYERAMSWMDANASGAW